ncbi:hypothetical protein CHS0354_007870 [Potamilus streckersoni]|uniref:Organic cation transporter n=1 Tax=Potamilus streckersoni TaxID=2493646 RepID=A0AAE0SZF5_9BIVA|nr:hypothetical protein CHS0354_007870 [Potamilus streckersoni]
MQFGEIFNKAGNHYKRSLTSLNYPVEGDKRKRTTLCLRTFTRLTVSMMYYGLSLNVGNLGGDIYINFAYSIVMEFAAYTISIPAMSWLGRKKFHCLSMLVGGLALLATIFPSVFADKRETLIITILAMVGKFASAAAFGTIYLYSTELFPTVVRSAGMGASAFCAGVGGIIAPYIVELANLTEGKTRDVLPLIVFGFPSLLAGGLSLLLPETSKGHLPDTILDARHLKSLSKTMEMKEMINRQGDLNDIDT